MQQDYDVLIVGGGLAGNCLALALQQTDMQVALLEASTREQQHNSPAGDRALALSAGSMQLLERLGVWQKVADLASTIKHIHISDQGHFGKTRLSAQQQGVAALGYVIRARDLEDHVADLVQQSNITQIRPARVIGLMSGEGQVYVSAKLNNENLNLNAKLLVGADGGNSSVRKLLNIKQQQHDYGQTAIVTCVRPSLSHENVAYERFTASGPLALLPYGDDFSLVWTRKQEDAEQLMRAGDAEFIAQLQQCFGYKLGEFTLQEPRRGFPLTLVRAESMAMGRVVLVGNAVHQLHPVAGQGFNLGLRDVIQLAGMLIARSDAGADIGAKDFLQSYVQERQQDHRMIINFTDGVVRLFSNDWLPLACARNAGLSILDRVPAAKTVFTRHAMGVSQNMPLVDGHR